MDNLNPLFKKFMRHKKNALRLEKFGEKQLHIGKQKVNLEILREF